MRLGDILSKLIQNYQSRYQIKYPADREKYLDLFIPVKEIKQIFIKSILLLTDQRPRSLMAIAYAFRLAQALDAELLAVTRSLHHDMIKQEAKENAIKLSLLESPQAMPTIKDILRIIREKEVGLVIVHNMYELVKAIEAYSPVPVLVVNIERFIQKSSA